MTQLRFLTDWADAATGVIFWLCLLWPLLVLVFWPWYRDEWGWNMAIKVEMIALAVFPAVLYLEFGVTPGYLMLWVSVSALTAIPLVILWRTWLIWRNQQDGARRDREAAGTEKV